MLSRRPLNLLLWAIFCAGLNSCSAPPAVPVETAGSKVAGATATMQGPPAWAQNAHEALLHYQTLVDYWVGHVKADDYDYFDAEGGWNDDVELAQSLTAYWFLTGDKPLRRMFIDMARKNRQAAYTGSKPKAPWFRPGDTRFVQGYHSQLVDVHHSSEEVTLVYPRLFLIDYGNPENIELMTRLIWNFEDNMGAGERNWGRRVSTGILLASPKFNGRYMDWQWPAEWGGRFEPQDVPQNFRATAPGLSLAWYYGPEHHFWQDGRHGFLRSHHDAWIAASKNTAEGKPAFIPPSKILVKDLSYGGGNGWLKNDDLHGSGWGQNSSYTFQHFYFAMTANWILFKDDANPKLRATAHDASRIVQEAFHYRQKRRYIGGYSLNVDRALMQWRAEVDYTEDDAGLMRRRYKNATTRMTAYNIFLQYGNLKHAVAEATEAFEDLKNFLQDRLIQGQWTYNLQTTDANCRWAHDCITDQVKFPGSDAFLMASLGGSGIYDGAFPTLYFSLHDAGTDVVSLVLSKNPEEIRFWVWNFGPEKELGIRLWRLTEGVGELTMGTDRDRDGNMDQVTVRQTIPATTKGAEVRIHVPTGGLQLIHIKVIRPAPREISRLPDAAAAPIDFRVSDGEARLRVHNIGLAATGSFKVRLMDTDNRRIGPDQQLSLPAFRAMEPVTKTLRWTIRDPSRVGYAIIDPDGILSEITKENNVIRIHGPQEIRSSLPQQRGAVAGVH